MKKSILFLFSLLILTGLKAQDCDGYFPAKSGTFIETKSYDAKGRLTGTNQQTILAVEPMATGLTMKVQSEQFDDKDKPTFSQVLGMRCENGVFYMDMKNFLDPKTMGGMKDMEMTVDGLDLEFPNVLQVGQTLNDGNINMGVLSGGMQIMSMSVKMYNRKVEAIESVTTPAGTFECYKLTYDMDIKSIMKMTVKATQWVARHIGAVKTETYDKKGNLSGYTVLSAFHE
ncbi:MAG: hypothetical protein H6541_05560 [Lentimicrobiaceae bacterium]|nr:hypothetical protein [Lentimicrobiaceae bacterium]MCO5265976.1 hypothetical protein [Lentimicrobium sp.]HPG33491.1 hypothetical protein [Lentimicrobium sp.]